MNINEQKFSYLCFALANLLDLLPQFSTASAAPVYRRTQTLNPLPEIHRHPGIISVNYLRVRLRRIEWQALRS